MRRQLFRLMVWPDVDPALTGDALRKALDAERRHNGPLLQLTKLFRTIVQLLADDFFPTKLRSRRYSVIPRDSRSTGGKS